MKCNIFKILFFTFQSISLLSNISIQQVANAIINNNISIVRDYLQQGGSPEKIVPEYNNYTLFELALIAVHKDIVDLFMDYEFYIKENELLYIITPLSHYNFNPNYKKEDQINIIKNLLLSGFIKISSDNIINAIEEPEILNMLTNIYFGGNTVMKRHLNEIIEYILDDEDMNINQNIKKSIKILLINGADINTFFKKTLEYHESIIENQIELLKLSSIYDILEILIEYDTELFDSKNTIKILHDYIDTINEYNQQYIAFTKDYIKQVIGIFIHDAYLNIKDIFNYVVDKNNNGLLQIFLEMGIKIPKFSTENKSTQTELI